jgi:hypothetical protein
MILAAMKEMLASAKEMPGDRRGTGRKRELEEEDLLIEEEINDWSGKVRTKI